MPSQSLQLRALIPCFLPNRPNAIFDLLSTAVQQDAPSPFVLAIQTIVTLIFGPAAFLFNITVVWDIAATSPWLHQDEIINPTGETKIIHFLVLVVVPALSFMGSCYILVSYWMDQDSWTLLRLRTMFASIPMCVFFALMLMGQSKHHKLFEGHCDKEGYIQQVVYLMVNMWQTMTVVTAYRGIVLGKGRFTGLQRVLVHVLCWGVPIILTTTLELVHAHRSDSETIENLWMTDFMQPQSRGGLGGIGWCGVHNKHRLYKAIFVNAPQMICVSFYAQFYYYIHQVVDPVPDGEIADMAGATQLSSSKNAGLMSAAALRKKAFIENTAQQIRLFMTAYMLSFLTNTLLALISDNMVAGEASDRTLLLQTAVVAPQGLLTAIVYMRTANKSLVSAYIDVFNSVVASCSPAAAAKLRKAKEQARNAREMANKKMLHASEDEDGGALTPGKILWGIVNGFTYFMMLPVAIWVWVPMEFLAENFGSTTLVFLGLIIWGVASVYPFYTFSVVDGRALAADPVFFEYSSHGFVVVSVVIAALSVWANRYTPHLLMIEGPVRRKGMMSSLGNGVRLTSMRNAMTCFTLNLEFYQIWGLTWTATRMKDLYDKNTESTISNSTLAVVNATQNETHILAEPWNLVNGTCVENCTWAPLPDYRDLATLKINWANKQMLTFWAVIGMCVGWAILYSLPAVITTTTVGNRQFSFNMQEKYRKYLWFMSGAGFLTVMKALMKVLFCVEHPDDPRLGMVALTDYGIKCYSNLHLQMIALSLFFFILFFPSASLTTLFRYGDEDDRQLPCLKPTPMVLGGEDIRWIHLWRRVEYLVKGLWVFTGLRFANDGQLACIALFLGSVTIGTANFFMAPSNIKFVGRIKFNIHCCNTWTTFTCFLANNRGWGTDEMYQHYAMMIGGWVFIWICIWGYEIYLLKGDVSKKEIGDQQNIDNCARECARLRQSIAHAKFLNRWGHHKRIVRLLWLCEHPDVEVQRSAFEALMILAYQDQMTPNDSFFASITPCDPGVPTLLNAIEGHPDAEIRNMATRTLTCFLQMNAGNRYGLPISFHSTLQDIDDEKGNVVTAGLVQYAMESNDLNHKIDAAMMLLEMGNTDSNDLKAVADSALPLLCEWLDDGNIIQQYVACELIMRTANRFDLAGQVLDSPAVEAMINLFDNVADSYDKFSGPDKGTDGFRPIVGGAAESQTTRKSRKKKKKGTTSSEGPVRMKNSFAALGHSLPKKYKKRFEVDQLYKEGWGLDKQFTLDKDALRDMQDDILLNVIQTVNDLSFASSAEGRRKVLDAGGLDVMTRCLNFRKENNLKSSGENSIYNRLSLEAYRAAISFLSGPFSEREIEIDDDFKSYHRALSRFKEEQQEKYETDADDNPKKYTLSGLSPLERRKVHIIAHYLGLDHISEGPLATRKVSCSLPASKKSDGAYVNPMDDKDDDDVAAASLASYSAVGFAATPSAQQDNIFRENWQRVADTGVASTILNGQGAKFEALSNQNVKFLVVDVVLLVCEHRMLKPAEYDATRALMLKALSSPERGLAVMGAKGMEEIIIRDGLYVPYGTRKAAYGKGGSGKGASNVLLLKWCFKMTYWVFFWKIHSGTLNKMFDTDELL